MSEFISTSEYGPGWQWGSIKVAKIFVSLRPYRLSDAIGWVDPVSRTAARLLSLNVCRTLFILPFARHHQQIFVACADPAHVQDEGTLRELALETHCSIVLCRAELDDLVFSWKRLEDESEEDIENRIGEILLQEGKLSGQQLIDALEAQKETGSRVGAILTSGNSLTSWDVALAVAQQRRLPVVDLLHQPDLKAMLDVKSLDEVWGAVPDGFWHRHLVVPVGKDQQTLTVAMVDPDDTAAVSVLSSQFSCKVRVCAAGYRDVMSALAVKYSKEHEENSRLALVTRRPDESASVRFSKGQIVTAAVLFGLFAAGVALRALWTIGLVVIVLQLIYAANNAFRLWLMQRSAKETTEYTVTNVDLGNIPPVSLPAYTVLVPVYKEAEVLPDLVNAIKNLQYPKDRLDVKLLLEEDDEETIQIARDSKLPNFIEMVIVPSSEPRTKPKACNYGLMRSRGEYVVIFDAEDIPEPDQLLKAISVFRQSGDATLACVQAKLSYYNAEQNILTRWFTAEYANWFELSLPALFSHDLPIPLGGTSNHFRAEVLKEMGAWDPYNVAEDADLGIRMHKHGYRTAIVNSTTFEEANADFLNWIRQRSRWVKGYMQTWLVHMRRPVELHRALGFKGSAAFHMIVGGTPFTFLLNPLMWFMTVIWFIFKPPFMHQLYNNPVYYLSVINFMFGNFAFTYVNVVGTMQRQSWSLAKYALLSPVYWIFMSIASWKALYQLFVKPSYWEKTIHGLAKKHDAAFTQGLTLGNQS